MKKHKNILALLIIGLLIMLMPKGTKSQPYFELGLSTNHAVNYGIGYRLKNTVEFGIEYNSPLFRKYEPERLNVTMNGILNLSEYNPFYFEPSVGLSYYVIKQEFKTDKRVTGLLPIYGLAFGKEIGQGAFYIFGKYSGSPYFGVGFKAYLWKPRNEFINPYKNIQ